MERLKIVVIGASAGGVDALITLLRELPASFHVPVMLVLHVPPDQPSLLSQVLAFHCALQFVEAQDKQPLEAGWVYCAPPGCHMMVEPDGYVSLSVDPPVNLSRPSIDLLFESAAHAYGPDVLAVLLSGASDDGAAGMQSVFTLGGQGWAQAAEEAAVPTMPLAALARNPRCAELPLRAMTDRLLGLQQKVALEVSA
ncbi:chemotaxis protein CheB [Uliginosibacterium sp. H1]|uniref:chemotaxis protein CheB n=1 Tax=Uliginosibacterium sp. H1 TaxID=3114757 RepID=UPI002E17DE16|nr:chemotaxis protein CheB [Uliginosibacterium sp. H1]